jgi:hypothetical protein
MIVVVATRSETERANFELLRQKAKNFGVVPKNLLPEKELRSALEALGVGSLETGRDKETRWVWGPRLMHGEAGSVYIRVWVSNTRDFPPNSSIKIASRGVEIASLTAQVLTKVGTKVFEGEEEEEEEQERPDADKAKDQAREQVRVQTQEAMRRNVLTGTKGAPPLFVSLGRQRAEEAAAQEKKRKEGRQKERDREREKEIEEQEAEDAILAQKVERELRQEKEAEGKEDAREWKEAQGKKKARTKRRKDREAGQGSVSPAPRRDNRYGALSQGETGGEDDSTMEDEEAEPEARGKNKEDKSKPRDEAKGLGTDKGNPRVKDNAKPKEKPKEKSKAQGKGKAQDKPQEVGKKKASGAGKAGKDDRGGGGGGGGGGKAGGGMGVRPQADHQPNKQQSGKVRRREEEQSPRKGVRKKDLKTVGDGRQQRDGQDDGQGTTKGATAQHNQGGSRGHDRKQRNRGDDNSGWDSRGSTPSSEDSDEGRGASPSSGEEERANDDAYSPRATSGALTAKVRRSSASTLENWFSPASSRAGSPAGPRPGSLSSTSVPSITLSHRHESDINNNNHNPSHSQRRSRSRSPRPSSSSTVPPS